MLRALGLLAGTAVVGVLALKLLGLLLFPLLGILFGAVAFALKIALIVGLVYLAIRLFRRWTEDRGSEAA